MRIDAPTCTEFSGPVSQMPTPPTITVHTEDTHTAFCPDRAMRKSSTAHAGVFASRWLKSTWRNGATMMPRSPSISRGSTP